MNPFKHPPIVSEQTLDIEARVARLERKIKADGWRIPDRVIQHIAQHDHTPYQTPEDALMRVIAYSSLKNQDITVTVAAEALDEAIPPALPPANPDEEPRVTLPSNPLLQNGAKQNHPFIGVVEGIALSLAGVWAMLLCSALIDVVCHLMRLITLAVPWLWWSILALNALTVLIPLDLYRFQRRKSSRSIRDRARVTTLFILDSATLSVFLIVLFRYPAIDIHAFQALGLLQ